MTLLSLVRTNIKQRRAKDAAVYDCDCHLQAGYDTGYAEQYQIERDRLHRIYYDACEAESATENALFALVNEDPIEYGRIQRIVFEFS